jgi:hypothetical protein
MSGSLSSRLGLGCGRCQDVSILMARLFLDWTRCLFGRQQTESRVREDLANQTLPGRHKRQRRGRHNPIHGKQWKAGLQKLCFKGERSWKRALPCY